MSERSVVVAAAILGPAGDRVLAARRTAPPEAAGRWELPGGKVEAGESAESALVREIGEELGCLVEVLDWLPGEAPIGDRHVLRAATVRIAAGEPHPHEHDLVRWLTADELGEVDWLEPDRPFLPYLGSVLVSTSSTDDGSTDDGSTDDGSSDGGSTDGDGSTDVGGSAGLRGIFFDEDDAQTVVDRLRTDGWEAHLTRERYHGEDDDEDHPWAVSTDAPEFVLELLVDEYDGWLDAPAEDPGIAPDPIDLPTSPRTIKRPT